MIYEKKIIQLDNLTLEEVIELLENNHYTEGVKQVQRITIEVEKSPWNGDTCTVYDLLDPKPNGKYMVEIEDTVSIYRGSKDSLDDICFNKNIIPD